MSIKYEIVLCVGPQHVDIADSTLQNIIRYFEYTRIWIISRNSTLHSLKQNYSYINHLVFLEEDKVIPNVTLEKLKIYFEKRYSDKNRAGWYYQQFLKIQLCNFVDSSNYLIWDSDTVPLRKIDFFEDDKILFHTSSEKHKPYFDTLNRLLGLGKTNPKSFITEHLMVYRPEMIKLIETIQKQNPNQQWPFTILDAVDNENLSKSGFSEYETYGTYAIQASADLYKIRTEVQQLKTYRHGTRLFSTKPNSHDLNLLAVLNYDYVTFEVWDTQTVKKTQLNKLLSKLSHIASLYNLHFLNKWILKKFKKELKKNT